MSFLGLRGSVGRKVSISGFCRIAGLIRPLSQSHLAAASVSDPGQALEWLRSGTHTGCLAGLGRMYCRLGDGPPAQKGEGSWFGYPGPL